MARPRPYQPRSTWREERYWSPSTGTGKTTLLLRLWAGFVATAFVLLGFAAMACGLALAALAGLLIPSARGLARIASEPEHAEMAIAAAGTVAGDGSE